MTQTLENGNHVPLQVLHEIITRHGTMSTLDLSGHITKAGYSCTEGKAKDLLNKYYVARSMGQFGLVKLPPSANEKAVAADRVRKPWLQNIVNEYHGDTIGEVKGAQL